MRVFTNERSANVNSHLVGGAIKSIVCFEDVQDELLHLPPDGY